MSHWIDDIERKQDKGKYSRKESIRLQDKKFRIRQNYQKNKAAYDNFIHKLTELTERINRLPLQHREPFGQINSTQRETRIDNKLFYLTSSRRFEKRYFKNIFFPFKKGHFKHVRIIYFTVAGKMDKCEVEIKEDYLEKKRVDGKIIPAREKAEQGRRKSRFHKTYHFPMDQLTDDVAYRVVDWLAFHEERQHMPFIPAGKEHDQRTKND